MFAVNQPFGRTKASVIGRRMMFALLLALTGTATLGAKAQAAYPDHPVRLIVPFAAGGVADITARLVAEKLSDKLGERFVVENQPGPGGIAAARSVLQSPKDGYTIAFFTNGTAISVSLFNQLGFDPLKDFVPISAIGYFDCVFVTSAASPYHSLGDVLKAARDKPGALNLGSIVVGSTQNLTAELFKSMAGVNIVIVPFRTTPDEVVALLRDDVQMGVDFYAALKPSIVSGKAIAIATSGPQRSPELPNVPTVREGGVANFDVTSWNALYAPVGTPPEVIETLHKALQEVLADPAVKKRALDLGIDARASTPAEIDARMRADIGKWGKVIAQAGIPKQ
ncbi:MAG TPA: tripartite tricarboxylate transporter substrate binding protein [Xanthobacteraceae bacterium]